MIPSSFTITYENATRTASEWGIVNIVRTTENMVTSELVMTQVVTDFSAQDTFARGAYVTIFRDGQRWFRGMVTPVSVATSRQETKTYMVHGAWRELERRQYIQPWRQPVRFGDQSIDFGRVALMHDATKHTVGELVSSRISTGQQVRAIVDAAFNKGAPIGNGTIDDGIRRPGEMLQDVLCIEAFRRTLRLQRDIVAWWDYSAQPNPGLNCRQASNCPPVEIPLTGWDGESLSVNRPTETDIAGVITAFHLQLGPKDDPGGILSSLFVAQHYPGNCEAGRDGVLLFSFDGDEQETVGSTNLAKQIYDSLTATSWVVQGTVRGADLPRSPQVGQRINISGSNNSEWRTMNAVVQRTVEDVAACTIQVTAGPPEQLGPSDMVELLTWNRTRVRVSDSMMTEMGSGETGHEHSGHDGRPAGREDEPSFRGMTEQKILANKQATPGAYLAPEVITIVGRSQPLTS